MSWPNKYWMSSLMLLATSQDDIARNSGRCKWKVGSYNAPTFICPIQNFLQRHLKAVELSYRKILFYNMALNLTALKIMKYTYDEVSRNAHNGETNAKKLITRPIMTVTSPNSPHIALTYTKMRFDNGKNCLMYWKWGWFSCPVRKVTPKYGSALKNLTLRIFPKLFPGGSIYVGTTSFNFHNISPWKIFHRHRHRHPCPVHFSKIDKFEEKRV